MAVQYARQRTWKQTAIAAKYQRKIAFLSYASHGLLDSAAATKDVLSVSQLSRDYVGNGSHEANVTQVSKGSVAKRPDQTSLSNDPRSFLYPQLPLAIAEWRTHNCDPSLHDVSKHLASKETFYRRATLRVLF
jgi:hypothetical protein